jgi:hypothetical protein
MELSASGSILGDPGSSSTTAPAALAQASVGIRRRGAIWAIVFACGAAAGLVSWLAGELAHHAFKPQLFLVEAMSVGALQPSRESQQSADFKNSVLTFSILGGVTGLAMGLAGGLAVHSSARSLKVGLLALAAGAIVGAAASLALVPLFFRELIPDTNDLLSPVLIHGGIWTAIGAVGGIAFAAAMGTSRRRFADAIAGAGFGAILATIFYHALAAAVFPQAKSTEVVANTAIVRFLAMSLVPILTAVGAAFGAQGGFLHPTAGTADHGRKVCAMRDL